MRIGLCLTILVLISGHSYAGEEPAYGPSYLGRTEVVVTGPATIKAELESCIRRDLRNLDGVSLVEEWPAKRLRVMAAEIGDREGRKTGVAVSVLAVSLLSARAIKQYMRLGGEKLSERQAKVIDTIVAEPNFKLDGHWLELGARDDIPSLCRSIVASFDLASIEPVRKILQKLKGG